jgi:squalene-associated FAD-dependent desaturase
MSFGDHAPAHAARPLRVAIVGGGLAGLATAVALADSQFVRESKSARLEIEIFESRRMLGGRATSYRDPETGELVDNCQHVSLGCCTNFDDFCRRTGIERLFKTEAALRFIGPNSRAHVVERSRWLPAPLHLTPSLLRLSYLTIRERLSVASVLVRLAREKASESTAQLTFGGWLRREGQSDNAVRLFWSPVIVSALSEEVDRASLSMCRKVFIDSFLRHKRGYEMRVPRTALRSIYDDHVVGWLERQSVRVNLGMEACAVETTESAAKSLLLSNGQRKLIDVVCIAVPWFRMSGVLESSVFSRLGLADSLSRFEAVPITSVHLWCERPLPFAGDAAVLPGRQSQWIFSHTDRGTNPYYQVVISASREAASMPGPELVTRVCNELEDVFAEPIEHNLRRAKVITEHRAVFSPVPGMDDTRPPQKTKIPNLFLAGDWTATGWPATMEGAVRSGYLAAEAIIAHLGARETFLVPDLKPARLSRWLLGIQ